MAIRPTAPCVLALPTHLKPVGETNRLRPVHVAWIKGAMDGLFG